MAQQGSRGGSVVVVAGGGIGTGIGAGRALPAFINGRYGGLGGAAPDVQKMDACCKAMDNVKQIFDSDVTLIDPLNKTSGSLSTIVGTLPLPLQLLYYAY